ncbi:MAG TPA: hypothetical protein VMT60_01530 [Candidatus Bathyarchaeia archaeon]|nr:hypothetical protein [Candidatus Bathyarchaeia archaeon]
MNPIARVFKVFGTAISCLQFVRPMLPLLAYFILKLLIIFWYVLSGANTPAGLLHILMRGIDLAAIEHYPEHLILMPTVLGRLDVPLEILVLSLAQGTTVLLVAAVLRREKPGLGESLKDAGARYIHLVIAAAAASAALFVWFRLSAAFFRRFAAVPSGLASVLVGLVIETFFLYAIPFILIERRTAPEAIRRSFAFGGRHFIESFLLVLAPFLLTVPTLLLSINARTVALQISPEFLIQVQVAGELMQFIATYLLIGGLTVYFIETRAEGEDR